MAPTDPAQIFLQEARELLDQLEHALLDLERTPGDHELIDTVFRALHTIKGSGAMFGFDAVAAFTHQFETAFDLVRKGQVTPTRELIAVALAAEDHIRRLIDHPESASAGDAILDELRRCMQAGPGPEASPDDADPGAADPTEGGVEIVWRIRFRLPADAMVTGTNPLLLLDELRTLGQATVSALTEGVPPLEDIDPGLCYLRWIVTLKTEQPRAAIEQVFLFVLDDVELEITRVAAGGTQGNGTAAGSSDFGRHPDDGKVKTPETAAPAANDANRTPSPVPLAQNIPPTGRPDVQQGVSGLGTIRVPAERLDELMDRVGELVIAQLRLKQIAAASNDVAVKSVAEEIERLSLELRDTTMGVRMLPIGQLFGRFRRLIHDLARELNKKIELIAIGEETELDKTVIERLNDPLLHLIRNAVDHGMETPEERVAAGKRPVGRITLAASHVGAEVRVSISDDGRGLDRARIRVRAEENGLLAPGARFSDSELFQVILQPGFSTARDVTSLSGRGVGLDVVKRTVDGLRGTIDIASTPATGSKFTLRLPLTLAIIDGLLVRVGRGRYVIPLSAVEECVELSTEEDARSRGRSFLNIRGDLVPFLRLRELFSAREPADRYQKVVIVSANELRVGLVVDQVIGDHQTVIKSLSKLHADIEIFSGATILGDGSVALILDIAHLVEQGQRHDERLKAAS
jgi:two-component system, chemotaxis family, sensor kinase CheA